jgi:hypothetical protein
MRIRPGPKPCTCGVQLINRTIGPSTQTTTNAPHPCCQAPFSRSTTLPVLTHCLFPCPPTQICPPTPPLHPSPPPPPSSIHPTQPPHLDSYHHRSLPHPPHPSSQLNTIPPHHQPPTPTHPPCRPWRPPTPAAGRGEVVATSAESSHAGCRHARQRPAAGHAPHGQTARGGAALGQCCRAC